MKTRPLFLALVAFGLAGCAPVATPAVETGPRPLPTPAVRLEVAPTATAITAPASVAYDQIAQTQAGITLRLINVRYSQFATTLEVQAETDPAVWAFDPRAFPPQGAQFYSMSLVDETGRSYPAKGASGGSPRLDEASGRVVYRGEIEYEPVAPTARALTLTTPVDLFEVPLAQPLTLDLRGRGVGDEWPLGQTLTAGGATFASPTLRLVSISDRTNGSQAEVRLELVTAPDEASNNLRAGCFSVKLTEATPTFTGPVDALPLLSDNCVGGDADFPATTSFRLTTEVSDGPTPKVTGAPVNVSLSLSVETIAPFVLTIPVVRGEVAASSPAVVLDLGVTPTAPIPALAGLPSPDDTATRHTGFAVSVAGATFTDAGATITVATQLDLAYWGLNKETYRTAETPNAEGEFFGFRPDITPSLGDGFFFERANVQAGGEETVDRVAGTATRLSVLTLPALPSAARTLTLTIKMEIGPILTGRPLTFDLQNRQVGDEWDVGQEITVWGTRLLIERARLFKDDSLIENNERKHRLVLEMSSRVLAEGPQRLRMLWAIDPENPLRVAGSGGGDRELRTALAVTDYAPILQALSLPELPVQFQLGPHLTVIEPYILTIPVP